MENKKKILVLVGILLIIILLGGAIIYYQTEEEVSFEVLDEIDNNIQGESVNIVENENANTIQTGDNEELIAIHITGEVTKPGIIYLKEGARIYDAIQEAGGTTKDANLDRVNLAYVLSDGQKINIPNVKDKEEKEYIISNSGENILLDDTSTKTKGASGKVNINTALQTELETLPGIGPSLAQRILEYRETNGKFQKIEDLKNVKGIGDSKYSNIKDYVCI